TLVFLFGVVLTGLISPKDSAVEIFAVAAVGVGLSLSLATIIEASVGLANLIRVDMLMLWALYGLTLLDFLFPQPGVDDLVSPPTAADGTFAVLLGMAGLIFGRHVIPKLRLPMASLSTGRLYAGDIFLFFLFASIVGYLHILVAVSFDPFEIVRQM